MEPVKVSMLPCLKNKEMLVEVAQDLYNKLKLQWNVGYDASGAIERQYQRADNTSTTFCIVIDFNNVEKDGKTVMIKKIIIPQNRYK